VHRLARRKLVLVLVFVAFLAAGLWTTARSRSAAALERGDLTTVAAIQNRLAWLGLDDADQRYALGRALVAADRLDDAVIQYQRALHRSPRGEQWAALAAIQIRRGEPEAAIEAWEHGFETNRDPRYLHRASELSLERGEPQRAFEFVERARSLDPPSVVVHAQLAAMAHDMGLPKQQIHHLRAALAFDPAQSGLRLGLAWLLATSEDPRLRDATEAIRLAEALASESGRRDAVVLDVLAAALASDGRFDAAVLVAAEARDRAAQEGLSALEASIGERLALYRSGRPFLDSTSPDGAA
jgi:tetratricopeptide (TPR) repeat protein